MSKGKYVVYEALQPYLDLVRKGLNGLVDGEHYFDTIAEDAAFEFLYEFPGWPRTIESRAELMARYSGYGKNGGISGCHSLFVDRGDQWLPTMAQGATAKRRYWAFAQSRSISNNTTTCAFSDATDAYSRVWRTITSGPGWKT